MKKGSLPGTLAVVLLAGTAGLWLAQKSEGDDEPAEPVLNKFMRVKLDAANQVLEGLVKHDFGRISQGAKQLRQMSDAEKWRVFNDAMYRQYSAEFRRIVRSLEKSAKEEKLESAAVHWIQATMSCIECHKHVRAVLISTDT
jgi:exonuclease VII small subunit